MIAGEIYVTGGFDVDKSCTLSSVERYSPFEDNGSTVADMPKELHDHATVAVGTDMCVLGGREDTEDAFISRVHKFDRMQGIWSEVAPMPKAKHLCAACAIEECIHIFGGWGLSGSHKSSVLKYDTVANEWSTLAPMPRACSGHRAVVLAGLVCIVGPADHDHGNHVLC
jgi:hypothetical protein